MHTYEWLTVAAVASVIFALMMIVINTRRAQIQRNEARRNQFYYQKSSQRNGFNRRSF